ncbi:MAG: FAD-dependent oxidoreductase [Deltaproteobacteria bacterium]|nr:MAG: FAD-dependent oxidoreductase [Deltaproteobacteria bacterium]
MTSRRDFVAMLLGAPVAATLACKGRAPRIPPGALVGTGMARGHAVARDPGAMPAVTAWREHAVAIVGAGVAGLAAAWELARRGIRDVVVLELDDVTGGTARGGQSAVTRYPWGAHYIVAPQREQTELVALLRELGAIEGEADDGTPIVDEALRCREPEERVFYRGRWYEGLYLDAGASTEDRRQLAVFRGEIDRWSAWRDAAGRPAFAIPARRSTADPEVIALDRISFAAWLDARGLRSERLRWLCDYACRDDYTLLAADTSAWAGLFYFAARQRTQSAAAQSVVTWPDGNGALVRHLASRAAIETGVAVRRVDPSGEVIAIGPSGPFGIRARRVIVAVPTFVRRRIVAAAPEITAGDHGAWTVANVHLRDRPQEAHRAPPAWDNVFRDSPSLGCVSATHQRGRDRGPTVWTWYYPFCGDAHQARTQLAGAGYQDWAEVVLADLERAHPDVRDLVDHIEVAFWGHGMIRPRTGSLFGGDRAARAAPVGAIHFAHTDLSGLALFEEAFDHGLRAAREVAEALA